MATIADVIGTGVDLPFEGKTYRLASPIPFAVQGEMERGAEAEACKVFARTISFYGPAEQEAQRKEHRRALNGGEYKWGSDGCMTYCFSPVGMPRLILALLHWGNKQKKQTMGEDGPEVNEEVVERMLESEDKAFNDLLLDETLRALGIDPTKARAKETAALATN